MAVIDPTRPVTLSAGRTSTFFGQLRAWNDARVTRNALAKLSAHELHDIGLELGDIDTIAQR